MNTTADKEKHECEILSQEQQKLYIQKLAESYRKCDFIYKPKPNLPILSIKDKIISMIEANSVVIIQGPTGCGKTTQIPQLLLDYNTKKRLHCNIIGSFF